MRRGWACPPHPAAAEAIIVERDMRLVELTGGRYHFGQISCRASLEVIARGEAARTADHLRGRGPSSGAERVRRRPLPHLHQGDAAAALRSRPRRDGGGVASGAIDVIVSNHDPQAADTKRLPFAQAAFGAIGLETLLPVALGLVHDGHADLAHVLKALTATPAAILGLNAGTLAKGAPADLVLFDPDAPFVVDPDKLHSRARNTPFDGRSSRAAR